MTISFFKTFPAILAMVLLLSSGTGAQPLNYSRALKNCSLNKNILAYNTGCMNGVLAPFFKGRTLKNEVVDLKKLRGYVVVLNFWFVDCAPCRLERPSLNKITGKFKNDKVAFISIASDKPGKLRQYLAGNPFYFKTIVDSTRYLSEQTYGIKNYPCTIVLDKQGKIRSFTQGAKNTETDNDELLDNTLTRVIYECLGKKYTKEVKDFDVKGLFKY
ncbi:hypothetical protein CKK33_02990 [Mucilaginibacter sp. MD40]|uniref:TlpA family protein disulfide reductase n=1 Tax=Mucilaginibacter sp. MD40 TaxID=2029590 RepID=UPI000BAC9273|nr:TlpA disulfide reductase family protein [Mucilaginibacter sp. MD40]PAW92515.1 hypothetical protein CKK33_02990 [Mucilaginibacter sp. MD40]